MKTVLAIFKDKSDAGSWAAYLDGISALWSVTADDMLWPALGRIAAAGISPVVVIVSARLYPAENRDLAARIKGFFPEAELLLLSAPEDPAPPLLQLATDAVRHLAVKWEGDPGSKAYFESVLAQLVVGRSVGIDDRLALGEDLKSFELRSSLEKEKLLQTLEAAITGEGEDVELFRQRAALLADELIENALYGAPNSAEGRKLFLKGEERRILPGERLVFRFGFDGETLSMEMADNWGTLSPDLVVEYLARNQAQQEALEETGGRGLFLIWRFFDHFHVSVDPGTKTVVGGDLLLSRPLDPEAPRGYHITKLKKEMHHDQPC